MRASQADKGLRTISGTQMSYNQKVPVFQVPFCHIDQNNIIIAKKQSYLHAIPVKTPPKKTFLRKKTSKGYGGLRKYKMAAPRGSDQFNCS